MNCPKCSEGNLIETRYSYPQYLNSKSNLAKTGILECSNSKCSYQEGMFTRIQENRQQAEGLSFSCLCCNDKGLVNPYVVEKYFGIKTYIPSLDGAVPCKRCDKFLDIPNSDLWLVMDIASKEICDRIHQDALLSIQGKLPIPASAVKSAVSSLDMGMTR